MHTAKRSDFHLLYSSAETLYIGLFLTRLFFRPSKLVNCFDPFWIRPDTVVLKKII